MNNDYLKQYLSHQIAQKAIEKVQENQVKKKDWRNKVYNLRSQSVAR